jgi:protein-S-isoprenylcysteine O-methyltransferase Ste14
MESTRHARKRQPGAAGLIVRNFVFTVVVPGTGGVYVPWLIVPRHGLLPTPIAWYGIPIIGIGVLLYLWCLWMFAVVGRGTPGPWDPPRRVVEQGPYRWVRNPIYLAAELIILGEAWLFVSLTLLAYAAAAAVIFHLLVIGYEEPALRRSFGEPYREYTGGAALAPASPPLAGVAGAARCAVTRSLSRSRNGALPVAGSRKQTFGGEEHAQGDQHDAGEPLRGRPVTFRDPAPQMQAELRRDEGLGADADEDRYQR